MALNETEVAAEMEKMVKFIRQEAQEKANEIYARAQEEFSIEKGNLVQQEKIKIMAAHERRLKQLEVQKKTAYSNRLNQARLKVLKNRDEVINQLFGEAVKRLSQLSSKPEEYKALLEKLIVQGLLQLMEKEVTVVCRKKDRALVESVLAGAAQAYQREMNSSVELHVSDTESLPEDSSGGVILSALEDRIRCANTLDARLEMLKHEMLPEVREALFND